MPQILLTEISEPTLTNNSSGIEVVLQESFVSLLTLHPNSTHFAIHNGFISVIQISDSLAQLEQNIRSLIPTSLKSMILPNLYQNSDGTQPTGAAPRPSFTLNLLASKLTADNFKSILTALGSHQLIVDEIITTRGGSKAKTGLRISLIGSSEKVGLAQTELLALSVEHSLDIAITDYCLLAQDYRLVCFDMDSTLIQVEVIDELAKLAGVGEEVIAITESAMRGELDFAQSFKQRLSLLEGLSETTLKGIADQLPMMDGVERLMNNLKLNGIKTAILSGGFSYFAEHLKSRFGFDFVHANALDINDGLLTGIAIDPIVDANYKAHALKQIAKNEGLSLEQVVAVGDGANDLKMLAAAGLGIAFKAKPLVRQSAQCSLAYSGLDSILYLMGYSDAELEA